MASSSADSTPFESSSSDAALLAHYASMPPVALMHIGVVPGDATQLRLHAPLAAHVNDKGCAFGGSLVSLMTLAGWGLVTRAIEQAGLHADVFVADSTVKYIVPLFADLEAVAQPCADASWNDFLQALRGKGRARIGIDSWVPLPGGGVATRMQSRYVAIAKG